MRAQTVAISAQKIFEKQQQNAIKINLYCEFFILDVASILTINFDNLYLENLGEIIVLKFVSYMTSY